MKLPIKIRRSIINLIALYSNTRVGLFFNIILYKIPGIRQMVRRVIRYFDCRDEWIKTDYGFSVRGHYVYTNYEGLTTSLLRGILSRVDVFVDAGAHIGYYCCHALSMGKETVAIEPIPNHIDYLVENIRYNKFNDKVEIFPVAVSNYNGLSKIYEGTVISSLQKGWFGAPEGFNKEYIVPVFCLDRLVCDKIKGKKALILMDVEGVEYEVLQGAEQLISSNPAPIWVIEIFANISKEYDIKFKKIFDLFFENGYKAYVVNEDQTLLTKGMVSKILDGSWDPGNFDYLFIKE